MRFLRPEHSHPTQVRFHSVRIRQRTIAQSNQERFTRVLRLIDRIGTNLRVLFTGEVGDAGAGSEATTGESKDKFEQKGAKEAKIWVG
jgi:hypothetical protein